MCASLDVNYIFVSKPLCVLTVSFSSLFKILKFSFLFECTQRFVVVRRVAAMQNVLQFRSVNVQQHCILNSNAFHTHIKLILHKICEIFVKHEMTLNTRTYCR